MVPDPRGPGSLLTNKIVIRERERKKKIKKKIKKKKKNT